MGHEPEIFNVPLHYVIDRSPSSEGVKSESNKWYNLVVGRRRCFFTAPE